MRRAAIATFVLALFGLAVPPAEAALMAYLRLKGQKSGPIKGGVTQKGREGMIGVVAVSHEIVSPRDRGSRLPTGKRLHKPLMITKELDKSSPLLYNMLVTNENISELTIDFYAPQVKSGTGVGAEVNTFTIKLTNANIAGVKLLMKNVRDPNLVRFPEMEEVSFTYEKIEWTWRDGGIMGMDDWEERK